MSLGRFGRDLMKGEGEGRRAPRQKALVTSLPSSFPTAQMAAQVRMRKETYTCKKKKCLGQEPELATRKGKGHGPLTTSL